MGVAALSVIDPGWHSSIQDRGRTGYGHLGVPPSGALDPALAELMNRIVGNAEGAAVIETAGGLLLEALGPVLLASSDTGALRTLTAGERHLLGRTSSRNFHYLAVRGGICAPMVLGSMSTDTLSGLGPAAVERGSLLHIGSDPGTPILVDQVVVPEVITTVRIWPGTHLDLFAERTFEAMLAGTWQMSAALNRIGAGLIGPPLTRVHHTEIPSDPLITGAIQVPPDGRPIVMLADHPTTGGYPVVAVVDRRDLASVAQIPSGTPLGFLDARHLRSAGTGTVQGSHTTHIQPRGR